jgi:hypothetical protein
VTLRFHNTGAAARGEQPVNALCKRLRRACAFSVNEVLNWCEKANDIALKLARERNLSESR